MIWENAMSVMGVQGGVIGGWVQADHQWPWLQAQWKTGSVLQVIKASESTLCCVWGSNLGFYFLAYVADTHKQVSLTCRIIALLIGGLNTAQPTIKGVVFHPHLMLSTLMSKCYWSCLCVLWYAVSDTWPLQPIVRIVSWFLVNMQKI